MFLPIPGILTFSRIRNKIHFTLEIIGLLLSSRDSDPLNYQKKSCFIVQFDKYLLNSGIFLSEVLLISI